MCNLSAVWEKKNRSHAFEEQISFMLIFSHLNFLSEPSVLEVT